MERPYPGAVNAQGESKMKRMLAGAALAGVLVLAWLPAGLGQSDMTVVYDPAFKAAKRPPAGFSHDAHNDKARMAECAACHHAGSKGEIVPGESSEGTPCSECHPVQAKPGVTPLMRAFHRQCQGCHKKEGKGPVACGECHAMK
jgi:hypothetical protein